MFSILTQYLANIYYLSLKLLITLNNTPNSFPTTAKPDASLSLAGLVHLCRYWLQLLPTVRRSGISKLQTPIQPHLKGQTKLANAPTYIYLQKI